MSKNDHKNSEIKIRLAAEEKSLLKSIADDARVTMSDYIRSIIFSDKKLVLLTEGKEIAKFLFLIHKDLQRFRQNGELPKKAAKPLLDALNDVSINLFELSEKLSDIHSDEKEDDYAVEIH